MTEGPDSCGVCGALPCDHARLSLSESLSAAITLLYTHGIITGTERDKARRRLANTDEPTCPCVAFERYVETCPEHGFIQRKAREARA